MKASQQRRPLYIYLVIMAGILLSPLRTALGLAVEQGSGSLPCFRGDVAARAVCRRASVPGSNPKGGMYFEERPRWSLFFFLRIPLESRGKPKWGISTEALGCVSAADTDQTRRRLRSRPGSYFFLKESIKI